MSLECSNINLVKGNNNSNVKTLQTMLQKLGYYNGKIDSYFGSVTYTSVKKFQKDNNLSQDGVVGPITCKSLNEKYKEKTENVTKTNKKDSKVVAPEPVNIPFDFDIDDDLHINLNLIDEVVNLDESEKINDKNLKKKTIIENVSCNMNSDYNGLTYEATINLPYSEEYNLRKYQKAEIILINGDNDLSNLKLKGYINGIKLNHENDKYNLEVSVVNYVELLNKSVENYNENCKRSEHCKKLIELAGLKADIDLTGLNDDVCTINAQSEKTNEDGENGGTSSTSGSGATKTIDEVYKIAAGFRYGGIGTGLDPDKAYKAYENGGRTFDCYDCSNFLFYCLKNFCKIPCRIVQGYSPYSGSRTHRVVQIKENGEWHCPKQAWSLTKNLRPFTPEDKYALTVKLSYDG